MANIGNKTVLHVTFVHHQLKSMTIKLTDGLTCQEVLKQCLLYVGPKIIADKDNVEVYGPKYLHLFGLQLLDNHQEQIWLPQSHTFDSQDQGKTYQFRIRFYPHDPMKVNYKTSVNGVMLEYLFLQILDDFLMRKLGASTKFNEKKIFKLLSLSFLMPSSLPFDGSIKVDRNYKKEKKINFFNIKNKISKFISKRLITQWWIDSFWICQGLKESIQKRKGDNENLGYHKQEFFSEIMSTEPYYWIERYTATYNNGENKTEVTVSVKICEMNHSPFLYFGDVLKYSLAEIIDIKIYCYNLNVSKKIVMICPRNEAPTHLEFSMEGSSESFVSMLQGFVMLFICYDVCINLDLQTTDMKLRNELQSFGPLELSNAKSVLRGVQPDREIKFLIHESLTEYSHYAVLVQQGEMFETLDLNITKEKIVNLSSKGTLLKSFDNCQQLIHQLRIDYQSQVLPRNNPGVAEINKLFQDDLIEPYYYYSSSPPPVSNEPGVYLREDLSRRTLIADINPLIKKYSVLLKDQEMMLVELQAEKRKIAEAFRGAIQNIFELNRFKPENFIKFYGTVWEKRLCVLMELAPNGDLLTYICQHPQRVAQKVDIMYQIVNILSILEGKKIYHGNIRSRKFMVFAKSSLEVTIKLSDSGISQYLDSHPLENPENIDRVPWLSPERKKSLSTITYESECYSVGTTLCEMIYRNDQFHIELKLPTTLDLKCFLENSSIPKPAFIMTRENELNLLDIAEDSLVPEARKILEDIWDKVISKCWSSHPADRPTSRILLQTLNDMCEALNKYPYKYSMTGMTGCEMLKVLLQNIYLNLIAVLSELKSRSVEIQGDTNVEAIKQIVYDVCQEDLQSRSVTSQLTMDDLQRTLMAKYPHRFLHSDNIRLTRKKIGQGHFGSVWGASICRPSLNLHQTKSDWFQVAAKMFKKGDRISEASFVREIALACELDHPKIVKMLYFAINPYIIKEEQFSYSKIMLIMEYMNMNSLIKYVSRKDIPLVPAILLKICIDIAEGMVYLSGRDIVHRDLAARNVLLHQSGDSIVAKVSDFGLARNMEENYRFYNTKPDEQMPFPWMPPEILDDEAERKPFSSKGDVWSFGITMWEVFSRGKHPSVKMPEPQNVMNWYRQKNRLPRENFVCENLYDIMMKCWRLETKDRPAFVELQQELSSLRGQKITPWG